jgi:hypothetical protein
MTDDHEPEEAPNPAEVIATMTRAPVVAVIVIENTSGELTISTKDDTMMEYLPEIMRQLADQLDAARIAAARRREH